MARRYKFDPSTGYFEYDDTQEFKSVDLVNADANTTQSIEADTIGYNSFIGIFAKATDPTTFHVFVRNKPEHEWTEAYVSSSPENSVSLELIQKFRYVKLQSDPTGVDGSKVNLHIICRR
ncbi:MAG: hypothetical protein DRP09_18575 [Candidatus Thorarchaeota archaeon]|nr:MAG: hypothetical protein DRP09_18575 [Candidatus Thorarchaeota archaeon]